MLHKQLKCKMKVTIIFLLLFISVSVFGQNALLVKDHNVGTGDCVGGAYYETKQIGDVIYYVTEYGGRSYLNSLDKNGTNVLDTLCKTNCGYNFIPKMFVFKDRLYYQRKIDDLNFVLKSVLKTVSTIKEVSKFNGEIKELYVDGDQTFYLFTVNWSNSKREFYSFNEQNLNLNKIFTGSSSSISYPQNYFNIDNQLNFIYKSVDSLVLYKLNPTGVQLNKKVKTPAGLEYSDISIQNRDILLSCQSVANKKAYIYRWDINSNSIIKELEHTALLPLGRPYFKKLSADSLVYHANNLGHLIIHSKPLIVDTLTRYAHESFENAEKNCFDQNGQNLFYLSIEKTGDPGWTERLISYDLTTKTYKADLVDYSNFTEPIKYNDNLFFAGNISTGDFATIYRYNYADKEVKSIYNFDKSFSSKGIRPLGLIGPKLYFLGKLDQSIGKELYSIESGINTGTNNVLYNNKLALQQVGSQYRITDLSGQNIHRDIMINVFTMDGKWIDNFKTRLENEFDLNLPSFGNYFISVHDLPMNVIKTFSIFK